MGVTVLWDVTVLWVCLCYGCDCAVGDCAVVTVLWV